MYALVVKHLVNNAERVVTALLNALNVVGIKREFRGIGTHKLVYFVLLEEQNVRAVSAAPGELLTIRNRHRKRVGRNALVSKHICRITKGRYVYCVIPIRATVKTVIRLADKVEVRYPALQLCLPYLVRLINVSHAFGKNVRRRVYRSTLDAIDSKRRVVRLNAVYHNARGLNNVTRLKF